MSVKKGKRKLKPPDTVTAYGDRCRYWEHARIETIKDVYAMLPSGPKSSSERFAIALVSAALLGEKLGETIFIRAVNNEFSIM